MRKQFSDIAKSCFVEEVKQRLPMYVHCKSSRGFMSGCVVLELKVDSPRKGWIGFGGFKDDCFAAFAGWTVSGIPLKELEEWGQNPNPNAFVPPPRPKDGFVDLRDRWRFDPANEMPWIQMELPNPPADLKSKILDAYLASPEFEAAVAMYFDGAKKLSPKNHPSIAKIREDAISCERALCDLWGHLADRYVFSEAELRELVNTPVEQAVSAVVAFGHPLIQEQIAGAES